MYFINCDINFNLVLLFKKMLQCFNEEKCISIDGWLKQELISDEYQRLEKTRENSMKTRLMHFQNLPKTLMNIPLSLIMLLFWALTAIYFPLKWFCYYFLKKLPNSIEVYHFNHVFIFAFYNTLNGSNGQFKF